VGASPLWLRVRLHRIGLRAINNAVDVTNFVLMECGQPIHTFDRARLGEGRVVVRLARDGEPMTALDGSELELRTSDLVIADAERPQAVAGVMGGAESGVESETKEILLEVAWFQPRGVRSTARHLGLHSDSSHRFERGVDHGRGLDWTARRALSLLSDLTGAKPVGQREVLGARPQIPRIEFRPESVERLLGMPVAGEESARILSSLGVEVDRGAGEAWSCLPPTHRPDLTREVDLIEEVMRMHGLDDLPARFTRWRPDLDAHVDEADGGEHRLVDALRAQGFNEVVTFAFTDRENLGLFESEVASNRGVQLVNPMNRHQAVMRTHLLPRLLDCTAHNLAHHGRDLALFEVARTYAWSDIPGSRGGPTAEIDAQLPIERVHGGILLAGSTRDDVRPRELVAQLCAAARRLGVDCRARPAPPRSYLHPGVQVGIFSGELQVGYVGELHPDLLDRWDLASAHIVYGQLDLAGLGGAGVGSFEGIEAFPSTARDLSLDVRIDLHASTIVEQLSAAALEVLSESEAGVELADAGPSRGEIEIVEDYRGRGVEEGRRALLLRLQYRAAGRTITDAEVQPLHAEIVRRVCVSLASSDPGVRAR
jgi:phenylalanyl-tRNA synthetase beta chain